jgi:hypothetical protein
MTAMSDADKVFEQLRSNIQGNGTTPGPDGIEYPAGGDLEPRAVCSKCRKTQPLSEYAYRSGPEQQEKFRTVCRKCRSRQQALRRSRMLAGTWVPHEEQHKQTERRQRRLAQVKELFDQNLSYAEIGERIGVTEGTVGDYARELGISRAGPDRAIVKSHVAVVDNITRQLSDLVQLVHDGRHVVLNLDGIEIDPETRRLWNKRLAHVGKAMRYIRSYTNKGEQA